MPMISANAGTLRAPLVARKTITFAGGVGTGAAGTVAVFTITGRVEIETFAPPFCSTSLTTTGAATVSCGGTSDVDCFVASTTATAIDATQWWGAAAPAAGSYNLLEVATAGYVTDQTNKVLSEDIILTIASFDISAGVLEFYVRYWPLTTDGALT